MTPLHHMPAGPSASSLTSAALPQASGASAALPAKPATDESKRLGDAARQFEAVFLRQILSSVERAASVQGGKAAGSNLYGSMLVDAVADSISRSGGMGLASMLVHSLEPHVQVTTASSSEATNASKVDSSVSIGRPNTHSGPSATKAAQGTVPESGGPR
jgi:flagellar protein FlgJ